MKLPDFYGEESVAKNAWVNRALTSMHSRNLDTFLTQTRDKNTGEPSDPRQILAQLEFDLFRQDEWHDRETIINEQIRRKYYHDALRSLFAYSPSRTKDSEALTQLSFEFFEMGNVNISLDALVRARQRLIREQDGTIDTRALLDPYIRSVIGVLSARITCLQLMNVKEEGNT